MHWACKYIGLPYETGGRGPKGFDCWGILRLIYQNELGIELPVLPGVSAESALHITTAIKKAAQEWIWLEVPEEYCAVTMSQKEAAHHVGVYSTADGGKIIHSWKTVSVVADSIRQLRLKGFRRVQFYRHRAHGLHN